MARRMATSGRTQLARLADGLAVSLAAFAAFAAFESTSAAQNTVSRSFSVRDGLVHERVNDFLEDRYGFLWIATWEGASRFDGRSFLSFGPADGLGSPLVWCIGESPTGRIWLGTSTGGLARLRAQETPAAAAASARAGGSTTVFEPIAISSISDENTVQSIVFEPSGAMLLETPFGVRRCEDPDAAQPRFDLVYDAHDRHWDAQADARVGDTTWFLRPGTCAGVRGRAVRTIDGPPGQPLADAVHSQARADGSALVATTEGLFAFDPAALDRGESPWRRLDVDLSKELRTHTLTWADDGTIWIGTVRGLLHVRSDAAESDRRVDRIDAAAGMPDEYVRAALLDPRGALWIGLELGGVVLLRSGPIESFVPAERRSPLVVLRTAEGRDGSIYASATNAGLWRVDGAALRGIAGSESEPSLNTHMRFACDHDGRFWIGADRGLFRTRGAELDLAALERVPFGGDAACVTGEIFLDSHGGVWLGERDGALYHGELGAAHAAGLEKTSFPGSPDYPPRAFAEDARGRLWIAPGDRLWVRELDGSFRRFDVPGLPEPLRPRVVTPDGDTLWIGTRYDGALWVSAEPQPRVLLHLTTNSGLPSDFVSAIVLDEQGAVWLGTARGLVRRDPKSGALRRFGPADGLSGSTVNHLRMDHAGALWAAMAGGVSRIDPRAILPPAPPPRLYVAHVEAGGEAVALASRGLCEIGGVAAPASRPDLVAEFTAVDLDGGLLHFEHRLEGHDEAFSAPHAESSVRYAGLAPGHYVLAMRAVNADGVASAPARVAFEVLAPVWRRPWFVAAMLVAVIGSALALHRLRVQRALALERIRTQIATDLHDDAGANLAQIAILSEVARRDATPGAARTLADVADLARRTRASIADLVWAVDPRRDTLLDLVQRVRQVALNLLEPLGVNVEFSAPASEALAAIELDPAARRNLLFLLQELLHNVARHAGAQRVEVELLVRGPQLRWRVRDDGRGFDVMASAATASGGAGRVPTSAGHGLPSARRRAESLGARIEWTSAPGRGTEVVVALELGRPPRSPRILMRWNGGGPRDRMDA
jgi:signal transduction histidine kinase/ligand-binding sensor domain-containing protein